MQYQFEVEPHVYDVVADLQEAGYETYIVGGAIRDLLQRRTPKDYDISTSATPEQVRQVFGRRRSRIIGKRFQLVHVICGRDILEVSTFRRAPSSTKQEPLTAGARKIAQLEEAENMIFNDNDFGTSEEDAWRRDFTVNALFYDPVSEELLDYTGSGVADIEAGLVRAIGDPRLRFEEDPVRMLRALKLVGQYGFRLERKTESDLRSALPLIELASVSRLSLELEKVMQSPYAGDIMQAFCDYGFIRHFLPWFGNHSEQDRLRLAIRLLQIRDRRVRSGYYRSSASVAMATLALPFVDSILDGGARLNPQPPDKSGEWDDELLRQIFLTIYAPLSLVKRLSFTACRILALQPLFLSDIRPTRLVKQRSFAHAMELVKIQHEADYLSFDPTFLRKWREVIAGCGGVNREESAEAPPEPRRRPKRRKRSAANDRAEEDSAPHTEELFRAELAAAAEDLKR